MLLMLFDSFLELEQTVFLVKLTSSSSVTTRPFKFTRRPSLLRQLFGHVLVGVMFVEELDGMEAAAVDVEVDVAAVEIRSACLPQFNLGMHCLDAFPDCLTDAPALYTHLHIEERQLTYGLLLSRLGRAQASLALLSLLHQFTFMRRVVDGNDGTAHTLAVDIDSLIGFGAFSPQ